MERTCGPEWHMEGHPPRNPTLKNLVSKKNKLKTLKFWGGVFISTSTTVETQVLTLVLKKYFEYYYISKSILPKSISTSRYAPIVT